MFVKKSKEMRTKSTREKSVKNGWRNSKSINSSKNTNHKFGKVPTKPQVRCGLWQENLRTLHSCGNRWS
jgi:ribosomal protein L32E